MRTFQIKAEVGRWAVKQSMKESQPNAKRCCQPTHQEPCWHLWCPVPVVSSRHVIAAASLFQSPLECVCSPRHTWWSILCATVRYTHAYQTRNAETLAWSFHKYSKVSLRKKQKAIHIHLALGVYSQVCYCSYSKYSKWCSLGCFPFSGLKWFKLRHELVSLWTSRILIIHLYKLKLCIWRN